MPFSYQTRIRYGECDQQGVVFNPNYMVYMDDATEVWISRAVPNGDYHSLGWEYMLVRSTLEWQGSARCGDILSIDVGIVRYGASSFDVGYVGKVNERPVFSARAVCVSVEPETYQKCSTPDPIRRLLGEAVDWDVPA